MAVDFPKPRISRFGGFELNHATGELFCRGRRVQLQGQPARALVLLVESAGEVVSREQLRSQIWPDITHGDFEASLNTAIKKIRQALRDSPQKPHFVQTVHRQGYRFIAPLEEGRPDPGIESAVPITGVAPAQVPPPTNRSMSRRWAGLALAGLAIALIASYWVPLRSELRVTKFTQLTHDGLGKLEPFSSGTDGVLVTDGSRIYFSAVSGTQVGISEVSTVGGETVRLKYDSPVPLVAKEISPDHSEILATDFYRPSPDLALKILELPGGNVRTLDQLVGHDGTWSWDGGTIAYARNEDILLASRDGSALRTLLHANGVPFWVRWSPDGSRLRFTLRDGNGGTSLWEVRADGQGAHRLLKPSNDFVAECCGNWSPDGRYFVFQRTHLGRTSIWALPENRGLPIQPSSPVELTPGALAMSAPVFSRDGQRIFAIGSQRRGELVCYDSRTHQFDICLSGLSADHVEFSRDGKWIAYATYPEGVIWRSRVDGSDRTPVSDPSITAWFPRWSPDGTQIAFTGTSPGKPVKVYLARTSGGSAQVLIPDGASQVDPNWSPDGNKIMFASLPGRGGLNEVPHIGTVDLKTRRVSVLPGSEGLNAPRWSPDGRYVVATALSQNKWSNPAVVIFDFTTGVWTGLERDPIDNKWWSADEKYFYFDEYANNDPAIFRIRMSDHTIERVASLTNIRRSPGIMGWWMGLMPDNSPMVLRDTSIQELYALDWR